MALTAKEQAAADEYGRKVAKAGALQAKRLEAENKLTRAAYKIQIWIKSGRSHTKPLLFSLSIWASGKRLHGGGDESLFICRRRPEAKRPTAPFGTAASMAASAPSPDGCDWPIPVSSVGGGRAVCPNCDTVWDTEQIADSIMYNTTVTKAADILAYWFRRVGEDADINVKYRDDDIRVVTMAKTHGLDKARRLKGLTVYKLDRIVRDTIGGSTLETRFKALLLA